MVKDLDIKLEKSMYMEPGQILHTNVQEKLYLLQKILAGDDYELVVDAAKDLFTIAKDTGYYNLKKFKRIVKSICKKHWSRPSLIILGNFIRIIKRLLTTKKRYFDFKRISDEREFIRFLKNNFRHFDDEEEMQVNEQQNFFINLNFFINEFQNKIKRTNRSCVIKC